jgi:hypothetical protein
MLLCGKLHYFLELKKSDARTLPGLACFELLYQIWYDNAYTVFLVSCCIKIYRSRKVHIGYMTGLDIQS